MTRKCVAEFFVPMTACGSLFIFPNIFMKSKIFLCLVLLPLIFGPIAVFAAPQKTENVFLIITDGLRWQELFTGAEELLISKENGGVQDTNAIHKKFWRETPEQRREALLPFFWSEFARRGQLLGNQNKGSVVAVANPHKFSYPGYSEIFTGVVDPRIDSNNKNPNPNVTVFEWLNDREKFRDRVAVFGSWNVFPSIFNIERSRLPIWPAFEKKYFAYEIKSPMTAVMHDTFPLWDMMTYDGLLFHAALDYVKREKPRVAFIGFGETDEWAHEARYDRYLEAAYRVDDFIRRLWEMTQAMPEYRGKTTFIITADHGRGSGPSDWKHHGANIVGAEADWLAVLGPDTPPLGEGTHAQPIYETQIASTIAALLGEDYQSAFPKAGATIESLIEGIGKDHPKLKE